MKKETSSVKFCKYAIYCNFVSVKWNGKAASFRKDGYDILGWNMQKKCSSCRTTETENVGSAVIFCRLDCAIKWNCEIWL